MPSPFRHFSTSEYRSADWVHSTTNGPCCHYWAELLTVSLGFSEELGAATLKPPRPDVSVIILEPAIGRPGGG